MNIKLFALNSLTASFLQPLVKFISIKRAELRFILCSNKFLFCH
jgi:hypothetical protein